MATLIVGMHGVAAAQRSPSSANALLQQAHTAEASGNYRVAFDRLYTLEMEHPRTPDALEGRAPLSMLLALHGDIVSAMLQAQALRDESSDVSQRQAALDLTTLLARRLRVKNSLLLYAAPELMVVTGAQIDEPTQLVVEPAGSLLLVDSGANRLYRINKEMTSTLNVTRQPSAVTALAGGALVAGDRNGPAVSPADVSLPKAGTWDGKDRPIRKIRSLAANSRNDLFIVDRDYDGLLRCAAGATLCAPWGAPGKLRVVRVGPSDFVITLDDKQGLVRIFDDRAKLLATIGATAGGVPIEKAVDVLMDRAYGIYLLDGDGHRIVANVLRVSADGQFHLDVLGSALIPQEGVRGLKNPSALAVTADGALVVAGKGTSSVLRFR